jgi:hypothetical protein
MSGSDVAIVKSVCPSDSQTPGKIHHSAVTPCTILAVAVAQQVAKHSVENKQLSAATLRHFIHCRKSG